MSSSNVVLGLLVVSSCLGLMVLILLSATVYYVFAGIVLFFVLLSAGYAVYSRWRWGTWSDAPLEEDFLRAFRDASFVDVSDVRATYRRDGWGGYETTSYSARVRGSRKGLYVTNDPRMPASRALKRLFVATAAWNRDDPLPHPHMSPYFLRDLRRTDEGLALDLFFLDPLEDREKAEREAENWAYRLTLHDLGDTGDTLYDVLQSGHRAPGAWR